MSGFKTPPLDIRLTSRIGRGLQACFRWTRDTAIRKHLSRGVGAVYSRIGFADRTALADQIRTLPTTNPDLLIDRLVEQGVLKGRFRDQVMSQADIQPFMLKATPRGRLGIEEFQGLSLDPLFAQNAAVVSSLGRGINHGYYSVIQFMKSDGLALAFSYGIKGAKAIGLTLGIAGAAWFVGSASFVASTPFVLGALTAACVIAAKYNDKLPLHGFYGGIGSILRYVSRKAAPIIYAIDGVYLGKLVFDANLRIQSVFDHFGLEGTTAFLAGLGLAINHFVRTRVTGLDKAYGGQLDPGMKSYMRRLISGATYSVAAEVHYIGTRLMLLGGATAYLLLNTLSDLGPWGAIPLAIPLVGAGLTVHLRGRKDVTYQSKEQADRLDHWKVWTPLWGLAAGLTAATIQGVADWSALAPIAYTTLYGSLATFFLNELHGSFHSINTSLGHMASLKASAKDLVGEREKRELTDHKSLLLINPHTGMQEHADGLLFTVLLNRKPGASFVCMYDLICAQTRNRDNHRTEREYVAEVTRIQQRVFDRLASGITRGQQTAEKYRALIANLRGLNAYYDHELPQELRRLIEQRSDWFSGFSAQKEMAEARRAIFEQLGVRGEDFRKLADKLQRQLDQGAISEENFYQQWQHLLRCYDPAYITKIVVARKSLAGDEKKVRKVENVASGLILRGLTIYKGWFVEDYQKADGSNTTDPFPNEDWISGTWTRVPNPEFRYDAAPNTLAAARYIWVHADQVLTELQQQNGEVLSTSTRIARLDNQPGTREGFSAGTRPVELTVNGVARTVQAVEYFYSSDPELIPSVKRPILRDGVAPAELDGYQLAFNHRLIATLQGGRPTISDQSTIDQQPLTFCPPPFDYSLMMDKNDVEVNPDLLPTILERARRDMFLHLMLRYPVKAEYKFDNPHPEKVIDLSRGGIQVIDTTLELSYQSEGGREMVIPFKADRGAVHVGIDDSANWKALRQARIRLNGGQPTYFALIYGNKEVALPPRYLPEYWASLDLPADGEFILKVNNFMEAPHREGDVPFLKIQYTDGTVYFARTPDGQRPMLFNKDYRVRQAEPEGEQP